jgi:hypothetical protein
MADLYNSQRILGVRLQAEGATMHNFQRTIGIVPVADAVTFSGNDQTLGIAMLGADQAIYNDQPVIGGVLISDGRTIYNDQPVVPVSVRSGAMFDFLAGSATGGSQAFTRSSAGWRFDSTGALVSTATNTLRVDHDVSTLAKRGALLETARTNSLRNASGGGAVVGAPGTLPTNWNTTTPLNGISGEVVAATVVDGINYLAYRVSGTAAGDANVLIGDDTSSQIAATVGQTWTHSAFLRLAAGSLAGTTVSIFVSGRGAAGVGLGDGSSTVLTPTSADLKAQPVSVTRTLANASAQYAWGTFQVYVANGWTVDLTLWIGQPQLELGATASSTIPTTSAAVTRAADVLTLTPADAGALTWRVRYDDNSEATLATGVTGDYVVDPATLARPRVKAIWATP